MNRLRDARPDDEDFVVGLVPRFVEHGAADAHSPETVIEGTSRVLREALRALPDDALFLIAEDDAGVRAGFVYAVTKRDFFTTEKYLHISEIATARSGGGAGAALMDGAEAWALAHGYRFVSLNVVEENAPAQRFYERRGYALGQRHYVRRFGPETKVE